MSEHDHEPESEETEGQRELKDEELDEVAGGSNFEYGATKP